MNQETKITTEHIFRRWTDPPELFGRSVSEIRLADVPLFEWVTPGILVTFGVALALAAIFLVLRWYRREGQTVGQKWALFLALLRILTILVLLFVWLLPAIREVEVRERHSRVVLLFDVSESMHMSDVPPGEEPERERPTRQDLVLRWLEPSSGNATATGQAAADFLARILAKNPVTVYRFGTRLDTHDQLTLPSLRDRLSQARVERWEDLPAEVQQEIRQQLSNFVRRDLTPFLSVGRTPGLVSPIPSAVIQTLSKKSNELVALDNAEPEIRERRRPELLRELEQTLAEFRQTETTVPQRTNGGSALMDLVRREGNNLVKGVIVFSDGRFNAGSAQEMAQAVAEAKKFGIPVFTVGVGQYQETSNLRLVDLIGPTRVQPEDEFPLRFVVEGENVPPGTTVLVTLLAQKPDQERPDIIEKKEVRLQSAAGRVALASDQFVYRNPEKLKGVFRFWARVQPMPGERAHSDNLTEKPVQVQVEDRKLNVLLCASSPMREYQFLRTALVREQEKFEVSIYLQSAARESVQDVDPRRLLTAFPDSLRDRDDDPYNLANYDVVIALDLDWRRVPVSSQENLRRWVTEFAGGFIYVAGPMHTFHLARDKEAEAIRFLLPVVLDNTRLSVQVFDRTAREPWAVNWEPAAATMPFFNLIDDQESSQLPDTWREAWEQFFWQETEDLKPGERRRSAQGRALEPSRRGFYAFSPVLEVKGAASVLARYGDPDPRYLTSPDGPQPGQLQPFFVTHRVGKGPVFFIGSPEIWRLRSYKERYYERFWTKLIRYMGKGDPSRGSRRGLLVVGTRFTEGDVVEVEAQLYDQEMRPLTGNVTIPMRIKPLTSESGEVPAEWTRGLPMRADSGRPGWFVGRVQVLRAGRYRVQVPVPGSIDVLEADFEVTRSDPERDFTRPDYLALHRLASEATELSESARQNTALFSALERAEHALRDQVRELGEGSADWTPENEVRRLFLTLPDAHTVPDVLESVTVESRAEGRVQDIWDKGFDYLWFYLQSLWRPTEQPRETQGPPWALVVVVTLLSAEWLTRKLLRLA
ncbi:MAG: VWA domain-containing protein [Gemmatales bacterium]|nr:VWA domain-containing protein [Gemmatales bacterium]